MTDLMSGEILIERVNQYIGVEAPNIHRRSSTLTCEFSTLARVPGQLVRVHTPVFKTPYKFQHPYSTPCIVQSTFPNP